MKRLISGLAALIMLFSITACNNENNKLIADTDFHSSAKTDNSIITTVTSPKREEKTVQFEGNDFSVLELIGFYIDSDGKFRIDIDNWQKSDDFDLFRNYFFGTWDNAKAAFGDQFPLYVVDDSEKSLLMNNHTWRFANFYKVSENVLAFTVNGNAELILFWIDIATPNTMYVEQLAKDQLIGYSYENHKTAILAKTDALLNEPEEKFLSIYRLREISRDYEIDLKLLLNIEHESKDGAITLYHDDWYQFYPVYLVSEEPGKLEFKTQVGSVYSKNSEIDVDYTLEKINGEWVRTLKFSDATI